MKKSCFVKMILILTVLAAVVLYIITHKFNEVILNPSKRLLINQVNRDLNYVKNTPEKDSLQYLIKDYITGLKHVNDLSDATFKTFIDSLQEALKDSTIDNRDYKILYNILKRKEVE